VTVGPGDKDRDLVEATKDVHRSFPTGVTIVTTSVDGVPYGLAVNAFSSLCLEPPMVLVCVATTSATHPHLFAGDHVGVNVLANDQGGVVGVFAQTGIEKFDRVEWHEGKSGVPLLDGVSAELELSVQARIPAYTHTIFIGAVVGARAHERPPLLYLGGRLFDGAELHEVTDP
jgi:flavin reductase (DIM6/NTAB) family NADH-FMN oxidoreductase RutF